MSEASNSMRGWFKVQGAADYCDVSARTVRDWIARDGLPHVRLRRTGTVLIQRTALDDWLLSQAAVDDLGAVVDEVVDAVR